VRPSLFPVYSNIYRHKKELREKMERERKRERENIAKGMFLHIKLY
jgi:hypothetical protein